MREEEKEVQFTVGILSAQTVVKSEERCVGAANEKHYIMQSSHHIGTHLLKLYF